MFWSETSSVPWTASDLASALFNTGPYETIPEAAGSEEASSIFAVTLAAAAPIEFSAPGVSVPLTAVRSAAPTGSSIVVAALDVPIAMAGGPDELAARFDAGYLGDRLGRFDSARQYYFESLGDDLLSGVALLHNSDRHAAVARRRGSTATDERPEDSLRDRRMFFEDSDFPSDADLALAIEEDWIA